MKDMREDIKFTAVNQLWQVGVCECLRDAKHPTDPLFMSVTKKRKKRVGRVGVNAGDSLIVLFCSYSYSLKDKLVTAEYALPYPLL